MNKPTSKIYRTTNWSLYNRAVINRGNIAIWFDPATQWYAPLRGKTRAKSNLLRRSYPMLPND
ncbi:hypothetical protein LSO59_18685 (plasmid) [Acinetobacter ursingii]|nr:hypothetical protein [Acinetobacter ursingii]UYF81093.1 hypothetical protein LSO59_18685 [Acinetobacter ursingii]